MSSQLSADDETMKKLCSTIFYVFIHEHKKNSFCMMKRRHMTAYVWVGAMQFRHWARIVNEKSEPKSTENRESRSGAFQTHVDVQRRKLARFSLNPVRNFNSKEEKFLPCNVDSDTSWRCNAAITNKTEYAWFKMRFFSQQKETLFSSLQRSNFVI